MNSEYKKIAGSNNYYITNTGEVFRKLGNYSFKYIEPTTNPDTGYLGVNITMLKSSPKFRTVHSLVAEAFLKKPKHLKQYEINHIDGNKLNNNCYNLEYLTHSENMKKGWANGQFNNVSKGVSKKRVELKGRRSELTNTDVKQIRCLRSEGLSNKAVGLLFNIHPMQVSRIFNRRSFANVI